VIQVSMLLSIPLMAALLFMRSDKAAYYVAYVLTFNMLVGPVFSSGSVTQERERQTLSLLLTTLLLAYGLLWELRDRFWTLIVFLLIVAATCLATSSVGLAWSALCRRTSTAM